VLQALSLSTADSCVSLLGALAINSSIVVLAGTALRPLVAAGATPLATAASLQGAYALLEPALGGASATLFAVALIAAGQSSTFTGTMAGQVVMEGFLRVRLRPWLRRLLTRTVAVVPAAVTVAVAGNAAVGSLLVFSQVTLAFQLPFAVVPLVFFASSARRLGPYAVSAPVAALGWVIALTIIGINLWLVAQLITGTAGDSR
jgi:manganese transport protein